MDSSQLQDLLTALGPADESVDQVVRLDTDRWSVVYDDGCSVWLRAAPGQSRLLLSGAVGDVPGNARAVVHETLLNYNALWDQTGGVQMAVADGVVLQQAALSLDGLDLDGLRRVLANFAEKLRLWSHYLDHAGTDTAPEGLLPPAGLRV